MKKKVVLLGFILLANVAAFATVPDALVVFRPSNGTWYGSHTQPSPVFLNGRETTTIGWGFALGAPTQVPLLGDVNGDGIDDIAFAQDNGVGAYNWVAGHSTVSGGVGSFSSAATSSAIGFGLFAGNRGCFLADINGDGYKDAVTINPDAYWHVIFSGAAGLGGGSYQAGPGFYLSVDDKYLVGDFNGDGKDDICVVTPNWGGYHQWVIYKSSSSGFGTSFIYGGFPASQAGDRFLVGDINGDLRDDAIVVREWYGTLQWLVKYAATDGSVFGAADTYTIFGLTGDKPFVADIDGDGKKDIGVIRTSNISGAMFRYVSFTNTDGTLNYHAPAWIADTHDTQSFGTGGDVALVGKLGTAPAVSATNCVYALSGDYNDDCVVDLKDFALVAKRWAIDCVATPSNPECVVPNY